MSETPNLEVVYLKLPCFESEGIVYKYMFNDLNSTSSEI